MAWKWDEAVEGNTQEEIPCYQTDQSCLLWSLSTSFIVTFLGRFMSGYSGGYNAAFPATMAIHCWFDVEAYKHLLDLALGLLHNFSDTAQCNFRLKLMWGPFPGRGNFLESFPLVLCLVSICFGSNSILSPSGKKKLGQRKILPCRNKKPVTNLLKSEIFSNQKS